MNKTFQHIVFTIIFLASHSTFGQHVDSLYQRILEDFFKTDFNKHIFDDECTGLTFDSSFKVLINAYSTLWTIDPNVIDENFISATSNQDSIHFDTLLIKQLTSDAKLRKINIDLSSPTNFENSKLTVALNNKHATTYLIRLSAPKYWNNHLYIELWIKHTFYSSGTRILFQIDMNGTISEKKKFNFCDDNG